MKEIFPFKFTDEDGNGITHGHAKSDPHSPDFKSVTKPEDHSFHSIAMLVAITHGIKCFG